MRLSPVARPWLRSRRYECAVDEGCRQLPSECQLTRHHRQLCSFHLYQLHHRHADEQRNSVMASLTSPGFNKVRLLLRSAVSLFIYIHLSPFAIWYPRRPVYNSFIYSAFIFSHCAISIGTHLIPRTPPAFG